MVIRKLESVNRYWADVGTSPVRQPSSSSTVSKLSHIDPIGEIVSQSCRCSIYLIGVMNTDRDSRLRYAGPDMVGGPILMVADALVGPCFGLDVVRESRGRLFYVGNGVCDHEFPLPELVE